MNQIKIAKFSDTEFYIGRFNEMHHLENAMRIIITQASNQNGINMMIVPAMYPLSDALNSSVNIERAMIVQDSTPELEKQYIAANTGIHAPSLTDMIKLVKK